MSVDAVSVDAPTERPPRVPEKQVPKKRVSQRQVPQPRRARLTVAPPAPVVAPRAPFIVLVLLVVVGGLLGILVLNTKTNESAFHLRELREQQAVLDQRQQELEQEIAQRRSTAQLSAAASRLGLERVPASERAYVRLPSGEVVGEPVPVPGEPGGGEG